MDDQKLDMILTEIVGMRQELSELKDRGIKLENHIENVTDHNISVLSENHINLVNKLNEAIRAENYTKLYENEGQCTCYGCRRA
ncbi:MAG: hypothetical protein KHX56_02890 [Clostridiales bacterium]|nr:hypothetical protein [Clostridiales bacterium]